MPYKNEIDRKKNSRKYYLNNKKKKIAYAKNYYQNHREKRDIQKKLWFEKNIDKVREYRRKYYAKYKKTKRGKTIYKKSAKKWRKNNRYKTKVYRILRTAIESQKVIKPLFCNLCGKKKRLHGHHQDYNKPLKVVWLCSICHKIVHSIKKEEKVND